MPLRPTNQEEPSRESLDEKSFLYHRQNSGRRAARSGYGHRFQVPKSRPGLMSSVRFLKRFASGIARALCRVSAKRKPSSRSGKSSLSSARSKPYVAPVDSHRMEAIEDCIQFINSSCTLSRSNSTTTTTNS